MVVPTTSQGTLPSSQDYVLTAARDIIGSRIAILKLMLMDNHLNPGRKMGSRASPSPSNSGGSAVTPAQVFQPAWSPGLQSGISTASPQ